MSYFDLLREIRTGKPDNTKAARAMKILGWICIGIGIWNFAFPLLMDFDTTGTPFTPAYSYGTLLIMSLTGLLALYSSKRIRQREKAGIQAGKAAIMLFILSLLGLLVLVMAKTDVMPGDLPVRIFFTVVIIIGMSQFVIPAAFGIRYLHRLPVKSHTLSGSQPETNYHAEQASRGRSNRKYRDGLLPFGIMGTFILLLACVLIPSIIVQRFYGIEAMPVIFLPAFLLVFFGPLVYNALPSPFEKNRTLIAKYTGGGSLFMFNGTWPFFRMFVYNDGIEIRVMLNRFFIPYDRIDEIPEKFGFFSPGIQIKSDLPGVPSSIRFMPPGSTKTFYNKYKRHGTTLYKKFKSQ